MCREVYGEVQPRVSRCRDLFQTGVGVCGGGYECVGTSVVWTHEKAEKVLEQ
jgi:hypothetical protein